MYVCMLRMIGLCDKEKREDQKKKKKKKKMVVRIITSHIIMVLK